jgi:hypothetical protein
MRIVGYISYGEIAKSLKVAWLIEMSQVTSEG